MDVLVTGAGGRVGSAIREQLGDSDDYEFTWLDVEGGAETTTVDVRDYAALRPHVEGQDAVIHLALNPDLNWQVTDVRWSPALVDNLRATVAVHRAAVDAGVERLLLASSIHVVGDYPRERRARGDAPPVDHRSPVRPDSVYAAEKLFGEALARVCADHHGLRSYVLRFGLVLPPEHDDPYVPAERRAAAGEFERGSEAYERLAARHAADWLSNRDLGQLIDRCLRDDAVEYGVFFGVSDNAGRWLDLSHARDVLGYDPRDDGSDCEPPEGDLL